jgi:hypothetical protein
MLCRRIRPSSVSRRHSRVLGSAIRTPTMENVAQEPVRLSHNGNLHLLRERASGH